MNRMNRVLVCVTQQKTCERLIKKGASICNELNGELFIIHVAMNGVNFLGNHKEGEALEYLFGISKSVGADLTVLRSDDIIDTIVKFSKENKITNIIVGEPPDNSCDNNIINELDEKLNNVEMYVMPVSEQGF